LHDEASGQSLFGSLMFNRTPSDQLRFITSVRNDYYQVPNDFDQQASGVRDSEHERDVFTNFTWLHTKGQKFSFALSPFVHFNQAHYTPGDLDAFATNSDRGSNYFGGNATATAMLSKNTLRGGYEAFGQRENDLFDNFGTDASVTPFRSRTIEWGSNQSVYAEDQFRPWSWLNLNAGLRTTHFSGGVSETSTDPRVGAGVTIPKLGWVLHGFYGHYYQAPPLFTVADGLSSAADLNGLGFLPLRGEHDIQREFGITIPLRNWSVEVTHFQTSARNYFDHDALGNSNVFLPLTIDNARIRGWETSLRSPQIAGHGRMHLAYSHQFAEARGAVSGGLTDFEPADSNDFFFLDHDQRDTLSVGGEITMHGTWLSTNVNYGSGFLDGEGPDHLSSHTTADVALGHDFGERWTAKLTATNLMDNRYLIDNSNSFGGTHVMQPRRVMVQVRYRFHAQTK
jgi:outer membrane receptor for ferrienterochelin and colicin